MSRYFAKFARDAAAQETVSDLDRILALAKRQPLDVERRRDGGGVRVYAPETQALVEYVTEKYAVRRVGPCNCRLLGHPCIHTLNGIQAWWLRELSIVGGGLGLAATSSGKTIACILSPLAIPNCRTAILLAKPDQRLHYKLAYQRLAQHFRVPWMIFDDGESFPSKGMPILRFIPYSMLSRPESSDLLEKIAPDFVICDEMHCIADRKSARTMRFSRLMANLDGVRVAGMSGTLVKKRIGDVAHLSAYALGEGSPFPIDPNNMEAWGAVFDVSYRPDKTSSTAKALYKAFAGRDMGKMSVVAAAMTAPETRLRQGFQERLVQTPGVVATRGQSATCSLTIHEREAPPIPDAVRSALDDLRTDWRRPDGEEFADVVQQIKCVREVASGFYYHWVFGDEPLELIKEWFEARKAYNRELRLRLEKGEVHLDSPKLCQNAAERAWREPPYDGDLPLWKAQTWPRWRDVKDRVQHDEAVVWIDDYLARDAAEWATEHTGIVWCLSTAFGRKVAELAGIEYHGGGPNAEKDILATSGKKSIVASIAAHGESRDGLQMKFSEMLVAETPAGGKVLEQLFARQVRVGQPADTVTAWFYRHIPESRRAFRHAMDEAEFTESLTNNAQIVLAADITFDPKEV